MPGAMNDPEAIASDRVHVRVDDCDGGRRGDHRFQCIAAFTQHIDSRFSGKRMGRDRDTAAALDRSIQIEFRVEEVV